MHLDAATVLLLAVIARNVRRLRTQRRWTLEHAASMAQLDPRHWQKVEAGVVNVTAQTLVRLGAALDRPAFSLLRPAPSLRRRGGGGEA